MVREILKIYTDNGLSKNPTFHDIELSEYEYKPSRMGMPTLTATLMWSNCLNDEWTGREYVELRGERFYIRHTPSSEKNNTDARYKHSIEFRSEFDELLSNVYFEDYVSGEQNLTYDKPCSNSSVFTFYGTIREFSDRLNCAFIKAGVGDSILKTKTNLTALDTPKGDGYCSMVDTNGDYDIDKSFEFSFEKQTLWEAITTGYNTTEIPFERRARKIIWGAKPKVLSRIFKYGHDNELLSISQNNANAKVINRITMLGSSENIPYYYPNETEYGHISVKATPGNKILTDSMIEVVNRTQMLAYLPPDTKAVLSRSIIKTSSDTSAESATQIKSYLVGFGNNPMQGYTLGQTVSYRPNSMGQYDSSSYWKIQIRFTSVGAKENVLRKLDGQVWYTNSSSGPTGYTGILSGAQIISFTTIQNGSERDITSRAKKTNSGIELGTLEAGDYWLTVKVRIVQSSSNTYGFTAYCTLNGAEIKSEGITQNPKYTEGPLCWKVGDKTYQGEGKLGIRIKGGVTNDMLGDSFQWTATGRMPFQERLVPPKYRNTEGAERFYNAYNEPYSEDYAIEHKDAYIDPDTQESYKFINPYTEGAPSEYIYENEEIKPTIEGIKNASDKLLGEIADIAFDSDDNDSLAPDNSEEDKNDSLKYEHSYFYIRLNKFDGEYGFDLIKHYSQTDPMTIQMTSGACNGCKFKVQVVEFEDETGLKYYKNPIQVNSDGSIMKGSYSDKVDKKNILESQQNTQTNSIWLCVQKDAETFGVIMPNQEHKYFPKIGDTFNIINIDLPDVYIYAAEKKLEEEGMRYMLDNNGEKFTFDINASRIFFAEHPEVLAELDEYSKIRIEYNQKIFELFISSLTINCKDNEPLPEIRIDLTDTLAVGQSFQQRIEEKAQALIANASNAEGGTDGSDGGLSISLADERYLNKQKADRTPHKLSTDTAFEVGEFVSGATGGIFYRDPETGQTYIEVDKLKVRLKAIFEELEIAHTSSIGGEQEITPGGGINISYVEELDDVYRCYFKAKEEDEGAKCRFVAGDQVKCQEFNIQAGTHQNASNKYYWRLVVAVNNDESYVDISKTDCDENSDAPEAGDAIVQLGNRNDKTRQSAIVHSTVDTFAPCVTLFDGIGSGGSIAEWYSLEGKEVIQYGVDKTKNPPQPFFHCYGSFYYGPKDRSSYLEFDPSLGYLVFKGTLLLQSKVTDSEGNSQALQDYLDKLIEDNTLSQEEIEKIAQEKAQAEAKKAQKEAEDYADAIGKSAKNYADEIGDELQKQIDGAIETWFFPNVPTLNNEPAVNWKTNEQKNVHLGDLYYDQNTGKCYRFQKDGDAYIWKEITDTDIQAALEAASKAQDTADGKRRVFLSQPKPPYDEGDLWVNATYGTTYKDDILKCKVNIHKGDTDTFSINDWDKASKYTDDSSLELFKEEYNQYKDEIEKQLDKKAETWYQSSDPSSTARPNGWKGEDNDEHVGDLWYNTTNKTTQRWTGTEWEAMSVPDTIFDWIDGKSSIFVKKPEDGYEVNDLWFLEADYTLDKPYKKGTLVVATESRDSWSNTDSPKDWTKKDAYLDSADLDAWSENYFKNTIQTEIKKQVDGKAETWYQGTDPSTNWNTEQKKEHIGDLWFNTNNNENTTWYWDGTGWKQQYAPKEVFDKIDGKADIFVSKPTSYNANDLWFLEKDYKETEALGNPKVDQTKGTLMVATATSKTFNASHWEKKDKYTDDTVAQEAKKRLDSWAADGVISPVEKQEILTEITRIKSQYNAAYTECMRYSISGDDLNDYMTAYREYEEALQFLCRETPEVIPIPDDFESKQSRYYNSYIKISGRIGAAAKSYTDKEVAGLSYLRKALVQSTAIEGGLILTSLIQLGMNNPFTVWSGINGIPLTKEDDPDYIKKGYGIASWYGGDMLDGEVEKWVNPSQNRYAQTLFRFDGSGYLAGGNITWDASGALTFGSGIHIGSGDSDTTLATLINFANAFVPIDSNNKETTWSKISTSNPLHAIKARKGLYSEEFISVKGINSEGGGSGGSLYGLATSWSASLEDNTSDALGANLGYELYKAIHSASNFTIQTTGNGNAVTAITKTGTMITANKGESFLPLKGGTLTGALTVPRININAASSTAYISANNASNWFVSIKDRYLFVVNESENSIRGGQGENNKLSLGTSSVRWSNVYSVLGNFSGLLSAKAGVNIDTAGSSSQPQYSYQQCGVPILRYNGTNAIILSANNGTIWLRPLGSTDATNQASINTSGQFVSSIATGKSPFAVSSTTVNSNLNADLLDGIHETGFLRCQNLSGTVDLNDVNRAGAFRLPSVANLTNNPGEQGGYGNVLVVRGPGTDTLAQLVFNYSNNNIFVRSGNTTTYLTRGWSQIAFTTSNVASATKLQTARNIWGQSFDGTGNVSGYQTGWTGSANFDADTWSDSYGSHPHYGIDYRTCNSDSGAYISNYYGLTFHTAQGNLRILANGNVGIKTTSPSEPLHVKGKILAEVDATNSWPASFSGLCPDITAGQRTQISFGKADTQYNIGAITYYHAGDGSMYNYLSFCANGMTDALVVRFDKRVGIGTTNPGYTLHVAGVAFATEGLFSNGYVSAKGQNTSSDARLKTIMGATNLSLAQIADAPSVLFKWKADGRDDFGSIAQYWQKLNPLFAKEDFNHYLSLDYGKIALVSVIEVAREVRIDKERIRELEREVEMLKAQLKN